MKLSSYIALAVLLGVFALLAVAADPSGTWKAQMPGRDGGTREVTFNLKVAGDKLTGTMSMGQGEREISEGKVSGDDISFVVAGGQGKTLYKGKVSATEIKFTIQREGREPREVVAKKA